MKPSHACAIWADANSIHLEIPATVGDKVHVLHLPNTIEGAQKLIQVLNFRVDGPRTIGTPSAPTKRQMEEQMKRAVGKYLNSSKKITKKVELDADIRDSAQEILRKMGLL